MDFPLKGGGVWTLCAEQGDTWALTFPGLDVLAECRVAQAWLEMNPSKRPTSLMGKFLNTWLKKEWRKLHRRPVAPLPTYSSGWACPHIDPAEPDVPQHGSRHACELHDILAAARRTRAQEMLFP
jgi:hypothetical protein